MRTESQNTYEDDQVVHIAPEDQTLEEAGAETCEGSAVFEDAERHHGIFGELPLDYHKSRIEKRTEDQRSQRRG